MISKMEIEKAQHNKFNEMRSGRFVTESMFSILLQMAKENKCPDGTFSDAECLLWGTFREALRYNKN